VHRYREFWFVHPGGHTGRMSCQEPNVPVPTSQFVASKFFDDVFFELPSSRYVPKALIGPTTYVKIPNKDPKDAGALVLLDRAQLARLTQRCVDAERKITALEREEQVKVREAQRAAEQKAAAAQLAAAKKKAEEDAGFQPGRVLRGRITGALYTVLTRSQAIALAPRYKVAPDATCLFLLTADDSSRFHYAPVM